ncbi:hypothetical protein GGF32_002661 [Allomyces javanicus]|nr:hypothetical protein GGF32_002661 [Allomyces javanicus]
MSKSTSEYAHHLGLLRPQGNRISNAPDRAYLAAPNGSVPSLAADFFSAHFDLKRFVLNNDVQDAEALASIILSKNARDVASVMYLARAQFTWPAAGTISVFGTDRDLVECARDALSIYVVGHGRAFVRCHDGCARGRGSTTTHQAEG